jgi:hypothetical protein
VTKTPQLLTVAANLRLLADSLSALAEATTDTSPTEEAVRGDKNTQEITLEQVRAVLAEKSQSGFTTEIRTMLENHGAKKLSDIDASEYPALLAEAEGLQ